MAEKKSGKGIWIALGCAAIGLVAIPIIGILAAIAIPAFIRYTKQSKATEGMFMARKIADNVLMHYSEKCEFPADLPLSANVEACCGGEACVQSVTTWPAGFQDNVSGAKYFAYSGKSIGGDAYEVTAVSDLVCGGPQHTVKVIIQGSEDCVAQIDMPHVENELD